MSDKDLEELPSKCKKMKIMPSLEYLLQEMGFDTTLDLRADIWLDQLKITWKTWKKNAAVESQVDGFFRTRPDAFRIVLLFVIRCEEFKECKPKTLPFFIIEMLWKFSYATQLHADESLKKPAFQIAMYQRNHHFFSLMVKTYELISIKDYVIPIVNDLMKNDNFRQASQIVMAMECFQDISVEKLLFPLVLQDKSNMIDEYLTQCPSQVKPLLAFLDNLLEKNFNTVEFVQKYAKESNICEVRYEKIHYKPLGKLVARLCNKFNVPIETCTNLSKNRTTSGLKYLMYQKYLAHNLSSTVWDDLVKDSLRQHPDSAYTFIDMLIDHDTQEALKWAHHLNLPESQLPSALHGLTFQQKPTNDAVEETLDTNSSSQELYYKSPLTRDQIVTIDTEENFYIMMNSELVNHDVVSIDCEWKPSFGAKQSQVALIQIGTKDKVYLVDSLLLNKQQYANLWHSLYKSLLDNAEIIKLGFGLEQDLREIKASIVGLGNIKVKGEGFLDLSTLWKILLNHNLCLPGTSNSGASLSCVVQSCFGKPLEKSEQCSNWELRPLRQSQIEYAALDAHILLQLYYFLKNKCQEQNIRFEEICNDAMVESKKKTAKKSKVTEKLQRSFLDVFETKSPSEVRFLAERTLSYLLSHLRYCGIDARVVPSQDMLWHDIINYAIAQNCYVLIIKPKNSPTANFPQSSILSIGKVTIAEQLKNILNTYKVNIEQNHIMTRCITCNSKDIRKVTPDEVQKICGNFVIANTNNEHVDHDEDSVEDYYNRFISDSEGEDDMPRFPPAISNNIPVSNEDCKTRKGALIQISNLQQLKLSKNSAILCENCGKMYFEDDDFLKSVSATVFQVINITHHFD